MNLNKKKIGILGGGQLGRMLQEKALEYGVSLFFLDSDKQCPCAIFSHHFTEGSFKSYDDILLFGQNLDIITIEIEHVNVNALKTLETQGKKIIPTSSTIAMIQNKASQKKFLAQHHIPTSEFMVFDASDITIPLDWYPCVQKSQLDGYDGKGVMILDTADALANALKIPSIIERKVAIKKELAISVAIDSHRNITLYPICEMVFDDTLNLVDYLIAPAEIDQKTETKINELTLNIAKALDSEGVFSIEYFLDNDDTILVNEIAPRTHNSAHYTMEATNCSQFEAQLRILLNIPLPKISNKSYAAMINLVGENHYVGIPHITNLQILNEVSDAHLHLYGKSETKPGRKMGHITLINKDINTLKKEIKRIKDSIKIIAK